MRFLRPFLLVLLLVGVPRTAHAGEGWDLIYHLVAGGGKKEVVRVLVDRTHLAVSVEGRPVEIRLTPDGFSTIHHDQKKIFTMAYADLQTLAGALDSAKGGVPGAEAGPDTPGIEIREAGDGPRILGLSTRKVDGYTGDAYRGSAYVTSSIPSDAVVQAAGYLGNSPRRMGGRGIGPLVDFLLALDGWPLKMTSVEGGHETAVEAVNGEKRVFTGRDWVFPAGYEARATARGFATPD